MDFNNGLYVFNGVPGLEASKGERIAKALQKLQTKIKHLEQVRNSEREASSKSGSTEIEDITLSDVRLKLLSIQLQYMRLQLRGNRYDEEKSSVVESQHPHKLTEYCEMPNCCKETQTGKSFHEHVSTTIHEPFVSHIEKTANVPAKEAAISTTSNVDASSNNYHIPNEKASLKDYHYHFKIEDVPFILGSSAFESHNLIANIQNLMAKMKTHNKALCGSRLQASCNCASTAFEKNCSHTKKMMKEVTKDLTEIERKQAKAIESFDTHSTKHLTDIQVNSNSSHQESESKHKQAQNPSNAESTTSGALSKEKRQVKSTKSIKKSKHVVPTNKIRPNLPQVARKRLLRSIKTIRTQLTEEEISWI